MYDAPVTVFLHLKCAEHPIEIPDGHVELLPLHLGRPLYIRVSNRLGSLDVPQEHVHGISIRVAER